MKHFFEFVDVWFRNALFIGFVWLVVSTIGSLFKSSNNGCGKVYGADKVLYTDLFCEVKK